MLNKKSGYKELPPTLSPEEEKELTKKAFEGDEEAREKLVSHNMRLAMYISKRYIHNERDEDDIQSVAMVGLIKAVHSFNPTKNIKLSTYGARCIENEIFMFLRNKRKDAYVKSIDESINTDKQGNELCIMDTIGTEKDAVEDLFTKKSDIKMIKKLVNELPEKEKEIIQYRYGIGKKKKKQADLAKELNISQSYISRIEKKTLKRLREQFEKAN